MITPASLQSCTPKDLHSYTVKDLGQMAKKLSIPGWHGMRKDELARALVRTAKARARARAKQEAEPAKGGSAKAKSKPKTKSSSNPRVAAKLAKANRIKEQQRDLTTSSNGKASARDRIVLLVRDPFWLHACWEVSRQNVQRAKAAMAEHWHTARPILRLYEVESSGTTSTVECAVRDIPIHGGVSNWYIDVDRPPRSYRVDIGYVADNDKFFSLARSHSVTTPKPGSSDDIDKNWTAVAEDYEKIYAMSGGNSEQDAGELRELFEERLRRPMGSPVVTQFGVGAEGALHRERDFRFEVDAEMIIYGASKPNAHVSLAGEPVKVRPDGTFTVRLAMPDRRQVLPVVASSPDGVEQHTIVLAVERNTKVMEPVVRDNS